MNIDRKKLLIIAIAFIVILIVSAVALALSSSSDEGENPAPGNSQQSDKDTSDSDDGEVDTHSHDYEDPDFEPKPTLYLNDTEMSPERINKLVVPRAEAAAREYVKQSTSESNKARQDRLSKVFVPGSSAITARKPRVDTTNSPDTQSNPIVIDRSWDTTRNHVVVTVFLEVVTIRTEEPLNEVSRVYQGYDVEMVDYGDSYRAQKISFSDKPLILRR